MAKWPRARTTPPPADLEIDITGVDTKMKRQYPSSEGVCFVDVRGQWPPHGRWPIGGIRPGGMHTWYVGGEEPDEERVGPGGEGDPNWGRGDRLDR